MLSVIIPVYNEKENITILYNELKSVLSKLNLNYELIFIDDGSRDGSFEVLKEMNLKDKKVRVIKFRRNFGQTAAIDAGFKHSNGDRIITMDGDLQNDPEDIPLLVQKLKSGYDLVSGWRYNRNDSFGKKLSSKIANTIRRFLFDDKTHDAGCTLKAYTKEAVSDLELYGEMHRYITTLIKLKGFKITELKVNHRERKFGRTKYNTKRLLHGFLDMLYLKFWADYSTRPLHFFGLVGLIQYVLSFIIIIEQLVKLYINKVIFIGPMALGAAILIITGTLSIILGFLGEVIIRTYHITRNKPSYNVEKIL